MSSSAGALSLISRETQKQDTGRAKEGAAPAPTPATALGPCARNTDMTE